MKSFEIGKTYTHGYIGDHQLFTSWTVTKRTASTVTIQNGNEVRTCRINKGASEITGAETIFPDGRYAKCPVLTA